MESLENYEKSIEEIANKVKFYVFALSKNYRKDIGVGVGNLIVLGYENKEIGTREFAYIGEYIEGDVDYVVTRNNLMLIDADNTEKTPYMYEDESIADAMEWWRVPTDNEVKLYYKYYKNQGLKRDIERYLKDADSMNSEELIGLLNDIKEML